MLSYRVQIFYTAIITIIICFGNLLTVATWSPQQRPNDAIPRSSTLRPKDSSLSQQHSSDSGGSPLTQYPSNSFTGSLTNQKVSFAYASKKHPRDISWSPKSKSSDAIGSSKQHQQSTTTNNNLEDLPRRYQGIEAIVYNRQQWVHYAGNLFSIAASIPLLFSITPNTDLNRRRRFVTLAPYIVCSVFVVVTTEFIIFGQQYLDHQGGGRSAITLSDIIVGGWGGEGRIKHVSTIEQNSNHLMGSSTTTSTPMTEDGWGDTNNNNITTAAKTRVRNPHSSKNSSDSSTSASVNTITFATTLALVTKNGTILTGSPTARNRTENHTSDDKKLQRRRYQNNDALRQNADIRRHIAGGRHIVGGRHSRSSSQRAFFDVVISQKNDVINSSSNSDGTILNDKNNTIPVTNNNRHFSTNNNDVINNEAASDVPVLSQTRISCFVVYQLWILVRVVFVVLVGRYLHFLQIIRSYKKGGLHPQPKRSNATRRGIINITINDEVIL